MTADTIRRSLLSMLVLCGVVTYARALDIPVDGTGSSPSSGSPSVAYVDVERLFTEHPMVRRLRDEFNDEMARRKASILADQNALSELDAVAVSSAAAAESLRREIDVLRGSGIDQTAGVSNSSGTILPGTAPDPVVLERMQGELRRREQAVADLRAAIEKKGEANREKITRTRCELTELEQSQSAQVMKDLYAVIESVAKDEGITIVLDYKDVLYGQTMRDITDNVRDRLRGR